MRRSFRVVEKLSQGCTASHRWRRNLYSQLCFQGSPKTSTSPVPRGSPTSWWDSKGRGRGAGPSPTRGASHGHQTRALSDSVASSLGQRTTLFPGPRSPQSCPCELVTLYPFHSGERTIHPSWDVTCFWYGCAFPCAVLVSAPWVRVWRAPNLLAQTG